LILRYHRKKYQPIHDRYITDKAYEQHLKLLETMSQYSKYNRNNAICKNLLNHNYLSKYIKFNKQKSQINQSIKYSHRPTTYIENILQQTMNDAIHICKIKLRSYLKK